MRFAIVFWLGNGVGIVAEVDADDMQRATIEARYKIVERLAISHNELLGADNIEARA